MNKKTFVLYCDDPYYRWYQPLYKSIMRHEPNASVVLHLINSKKKVAGSIKHVLKPVDGVSMGDLIICNKMSYLLETMTKVPSDIYILMDIDMMVNRPLTPLDADYDVAGFVVKSDKVAGGFLAVRDSQTANAMLVQYDKYLREPPYFFNKDQPYLAKLYNEYASKGLKWLHLDRSFIDDTLNPKSYVWSAHKVSSGTKDVKYQKFTGAIKCV